MGWRARKTKRIGPFRITASWNGLRSLFRPRITWGTRVGWWSWNRRTGHTINTPGFGWWKIDKRRKRG